MADAIVSAVLEKLTSITADEIEKEVRRVINVRGEVEKLTSNFQAIQAVLEDAERQQLEKEKAIVRAWLDKLRNTSYDIDNVLEEWSTAILKSKLGKKVCSFIPSPSFCFNRGKLLHKIALEIQKLNERLDVIAKERERYNFKEVPVEKLKREETVSLINVAEVCGRVEDEKRLVNMLLEESRPEELGSAHPIISIVGTGGIGKTTLAQLAFNNDEVISHFEKRIWVCVSDPFDEMRIAIEILESVGSVANDDDDLGKLEKVLKSLKDSIMDKKFLLVLDDVWTEQYGRWDRVKLSLSSGSLGSKILVTTRKETVARMMGCTTLFLVEQLSGEEGWSLFSQIALFGRSSKDSENLGKIGREIARKCKGLPLAIRTLGAFMRLKRTEKEWQRVLDSEIWELEVAEEGIFRPLMFSYYDLPSHLKQCFSYCAIFPKDYVIEKNELIELWMAQGFLKGIQHKDMEMVGEDYFNQLAMRSFFQDFEKDEHGDIIKCKMHHIVHDFARFLTRGECLAMESTRSYSTEGFNERARHMMLLMSVFSEFPICIYDAKNLHTLLMESSGWHSEFYLDLSKLFRKLKYLRTLKCHHHSIKICPRQVGKLLHLRHLDLSNNLHLKTLPEAVCDLYNLIILDISGCRNLTRLPSRIGNLINLMHLRNGDISRSCFMPKGMEKLTCLQTLSQLVLGGSRKAAALGDLENLIHLRGRLEIQRLGDIRDEEEAKKAQLQNKTGLTELVLSAGPGWKTVSKKAIPVLKALKPPADLEKLDITGFRSPTMWVWPSWIVSLTKLKELELSFCSNTDHLPPLGALPSLESLKLLDIRKVKKVGVEFLGIRGSFSPSSSSIVAFPNLKSLWFWKMEQWEEWDYESGGEEDITIMPCLSRLEILLCKKLKALPDHILQNTTLQELNISYSPFIEERYKVSTDPRIRRRS